MISAFDAMKVVSAGPTRKTLKTQHILSHISLCDKISMHKVRLAQL